MLTGQNGILNRAAEAKEKTSQAEKNEKVGAIKMEEMINDNFSEESIEETDDTNPGTLEQDTSDPNIYIVNSIEDLVVFSYNVSNGNTYEGKTVKLGITLDFNSTKSYCDAFREDYEKYGYRGELREALISGNGWKSIGNEVDIGQNNFKGTFDGNNKCICNLYINKNDINEIGYIGLFANNQGNIKNLSLKNAKINTSGNDEIYHFIGGISGNNEGTIINCATYGIYHSDGNSALISGIAGRNQGSIELCTNNAKISGNAMYMSGISAQNLSKIKKCNNLGEINSEKSGRYVGGITGLGYSKKVSDEDSVIEESYNKGKISVIANDSLSVGGIVGQLQCIVKNCYNIGEISVVIEKTKITCNVGGITGIQVGVLQNCYSESQIDTRKINDGQVDLFIGGIIGNYHQYSSKNLYSETSFKSSNSTNIGSVMGVAVNGAVILEMKNLYFYGQESAIGSDLSGKSIQCNDLSEKPNQSKILEIINADDENKFIEDTKNINNGYPILYWQN